MTLYTISSTSRIGVREDAFVWRSGAKYWFVGATLAGNRWGINSLSWDRYYIMTGNQGIGILDYDDNGRRIALVEEGREILIARVDETQTDPTDSRPFLEEPTIWGFSRQYPEYWSVWYSTKTELKAAQPSENAQKILSVMEKWEKTSHSTLLWVKDTLRNQAEHRDTVETFVAGHYWLWHNITKGVVIIGHEQNIWGSAHLHSGEKLIARVALLPSNGWLVDITGQEKYLLHWNGHSVKVRAFVFPWGPWDDFGKWRFWRVDSAILTPENQLTVVPRRFSLIRTYPNWAYFFDFRLRERVLLIDRGGKSPDLDLSGYKYRLGAPVLCLGEQHVLIFHSDDRGRECISLTNISSVANVKQRPRSLWQVVVDPRGYVDFIHPVYLKDEEGAVGVFAFLFYKPNEGTCGICLINERKEFWIPPICLESVGLDYYESTDEAIGGNKPAIAVRTRNDEQIRVWAIIRVSNGKGYMQLHPGITLSGPFIPIPEGEEGLWPYLASALGIEHTPKKK